MESNQTIFHIVQHNPEDVFMDYDAFPAYVEKHMESDNIAVLCIGIHGLEYLDSYGMDISRWDRKLTEKIQARIYALLGTKDMFVKADSHRYFVIHACSSEDSASTLAKKMIGQFSEPCTYEGHTFYLSLAIGIGFYPQESSDLHTLMRISEKKMLRGKKRGNHSIESSIPLSDDMIDLVDMLKKELPKALENGEIYFVYHPQYSMQKQCYTGAELLVRWEHPIFGEISPDVFIPFSEQNGMDAIIATKAMITAAKLFNILKKEEREDFSLSINMSPYNLISGDMYETLLFVQSAYGLEGKHLHVEITEDVLLEHSQYLYDILEKVRMTGVKIEIDDFGTGYTSIKQLAELPLDVVKIDKSYIQGIEYDTKRRTLFESIVKMLRALELEIVVEGVESEEEMQILAQFPFLVVQGYYYTKPLREDDFIALLEEQNIKSRKSLIDF